MRGFCLGGQAEQHGFDHHTGVVSGHMGELQAASHITNRIDPPIGAAQIGAHFDTRAIILNACNIQIQLINIRLAPDCHQQMATLEHPPVLRLDFNRALLAADFLGHCVFGNLDPLGLQIIQHNRRQFRIILAQRLHALNHGHITAQPPVRLCHFHADGATADNQQVFGFRAVFENGFVGVIGHRIQPRNWRHKGG